MASLISRTAPNAFSTTILLKKERMKEFNIFDQNHGLIRLEKCQFCNFRKIDVL